MSSHLGFKCLNVYNLSKRLLVACYELTHELPPEEKTNLTHYIRNAALTAHMSIARGAFMKEGKKRKKCFKSAQNALIVIDAASEALIDVHYIKEEQRAPIIALSSECFQLLTQLLE